MGCKAANHNNSQCYCEDLQHRRPPKSADARGAMGMQRFLEYTPTKPALAPGQTVVVVGGRGFVGSHIVHALIHADYRVHVLGPDMPHDLLPDLVGRYGSVFCSINDETTLLDALQRIRPAAIVSCAAFGAGGEGLMRAGARDGEAAYRVNVEGFRTLLRVAAQTQVAQVIWTSSTTVYGDAASYNADRVDETAPKRPHTMYGLTKHLAEDIAAFVNRGQTLPVIGVRLPLILGPGLWYRGAAAVLSDLIAAARAGARHRLVFHNAPMDLMHVRDAADAVLCVLRHAGALRPVYNLNGFTATARQIITALQTRAPGFAVVLTEQPPEHLFPLVDDAAFKRDTGFVPAYDLCRLVRALMSSKEEAS